MVTLDFDLRVDFSNQGGNLDSLPRNDRIPGFRTENRTIFRCDLPPKSCVTTLTRKTLINLVSVFGAGHICPPNSETEPEARSWIVEKGRYYGPLCSSLRLKDFGKLAGNVRLGPVKGSAQPVLFRGGSVRNGRLKLVFDNLTSVKEGKIAGAPADTVIGLGVVRKDWMTT